MDDILNFGFETIRRNQFLNLTYRIFVTLIQLWVSTWAILWVSVFAYVIFYNLYIPSVLMSKEVYIQYDSTCDMKGSVSSCKIPTANIPLTEGRTPQLLRGQTYRFSIDLKLPESEVNWSQGMFMVRLTLYDQKRNVVSTVAKPTGLKYKSSALRGVFLLLYWPLYVMGFAEETQYISVDLINDFIEGSHPRVGPTSEAKIQFEVRDVQVYPPTILKITATLTGLRYYMYHWPVTSLAIGASSISFFLYIITLIGFTKWYQSFQIDDQNDNKDNEEDINDGIVEDNEEIEDLMNEEINRIDDEINEREKELNEDLGEDRLSEDLNESGLTGDLSANESEASSTVVIPENEDIDDSQPLPDSSSLET